MQISQDTREQAPLDFGPDHEVTEATLSTGDYAPAGLETVAVVERKSLADLVGCMTSGRDRFQRELARLQAYDLAAVVVDDASLQDLADGNYRSKLHPSAAMGTLAAWQARHPSVQWVFCGTREIAARYVVSLFRNYSKQVRTRMTAMAACLAT